MFLRMFGFYYPVDFSFRDKCKRPRSLTVVHALGQSITLFEKEYFAFDYF